MLKKIQRYENFLIFLLIFIFCCIFFRHLFLIDFTADSLKAITASKIPETESLSYWWSMFTYPNHAEQFRPFSLFAYFYTMGKVFGNSVIAFRLVSFLLTALLGSCVYRFLKDQIPPLPLISCIFIILAHPLMDFIQYEISHNIKYLLPLTSLFLCLNIIKFRTLSTKNIFYMFLLLSLSLLSHEASFTVAGVLALYILLLKKEKFEPRIFILFIPGIIWFLARTLLWKIPNGGSFAVGGFHLYVYKLIYYTYYSFGVILDNMHNHGRNFENNTLIKEVLLFLFIVITAIVSLVKYRKKELLFLSLSSFLLLIPFCMLRDHIYANRAIWTVPFAMIFFFILIKQVSMKTRIYHLLASVIVVMASVNISDSYSIRVKPFYEKKIKSLIIPYIELNKSSKFIEFGLSNEIIKKIGHFESTLIYPGYLAYKYPGHEIHLHLIETGRKHRVIIIREGVYYYHLRTKSNMHLVHGPYGRKFKIKAHNIINKPQFITLLGKTSE